MVKREKDWFHIVTPKDKNMIAAPSYIRKLLDLDSLDVGNVYRRMESLENRICVLERPLKKKAILKLLENGDSHNCMWIENRVPNSSYWLIRELLAELVSEQELQTKKSGSQILYFTKKEK